MDTDTERLLLQESPDAIITTSGDGAVLFWNRAAETIFGYPGAEALGRTLQDLIVPVELAAEEKEFLRQTIEEGPATSYESMRKTRNGSLVYIHGSRRAVRKEDGSLRFVVSVKKDVTALKVQRHARLMEARFGELIESTPDGIVIVNPTGRIVLANAQAEKMFGYARAAMRALPVEMLLPARYRMAHIGHRSGFFSQPRVRTMGAGLDLYGLRTDGTEFPVEISLSPLITDEGTLVMSAIRDVSASKRADQKFRGLLESAPGRDHHRHPRGTHFPGQLADRKTVRLRARRDARTEDRDAAARALSRQAPGASRRILRRSQGAPHGGRA